MKMGEIVGLLVYARLLGAKSENEHPLNYVMAQWWCQSVSDKFSTSTTWPVFIKPDIDEMGYNACKMFWYRIFRQEQKMPIPSFLDLICCTYSSDGNIWADGAQR